MPRAISPNKPPIKRFSQSIPSIASVTEIDTINSDQSSTKSRRILDFDRLKLYVHVFFSIRSNSPHNGPLGPLCGWVFHIEGRQRDQFKIDNFGYISYFLCKFSGGHVQFQFWGDAIALWVRIQCCFVATTKLKFCGCYKSHLS